jgi:hypothetical protein
MAWRNYGTGSKYHAKKVSIQGEVFDSKKEARRFLELQMLEKAGRISGLQRQKKFVLVPAQYEPETTGPRGGRIKGKLLEREVAYYADFVYFDEEEKDFVIEDTKGVRTKDYIIKRKLMLWLKGYQIREV